MNLEGQNIEYKRIWKDEYLLSLFLLLITLAISFSSCKRESTLYPHHWVALGGEFDSLTNKLEWQFNDFTSLDSLRLSIKRIEELAANASTDHSIKKSRAMYWKSRFLWRLEMHDSSIKVAKEALTLFDHEKYQYDKLRLLCLIYMQTDTISGGDKYQLYDECLRWSKNNNDEAFQASTSILMGNLLALIDENKKALYYFYLTDSLNRQLGYDKLIVKNKINEARVWSNLGKKNVSDSILKSLISNPVLQNDTFAKDLILRNLFISTNEISYLYRANDQIKGNDNFNNLKALYSSLLLNYHNERNNYDSILYYANLVHHYLPHTLNYNHKAMAWRALGNAWIVEGNIDSAYVCRLRYENYLDSIQMQRSASEVLRLSALQEIGAREAEYKAANFRRNMITAFVILAIVAIGVVVALMLNRRNMRQKMRAMANELELEKAKRKMAATVLSIEEKDNMLDTLCTELSDMRKEGEIKEENVRRLESTIKSHLLEHANEETFREMFDTVNPGFTEKLRELCPDLADSYVKLASYILMELDNKRIASLMMVKPESVRQSRWRLSQRLHIPEGETLESFLRNLNKSCGC